MMQATEHCYNPTSAWNNTSVYSLHGNGGQQQYRHQYVDPRTSYDDSRHYRVTAGRQYVAVPSASYRTDADSPGLGPCLDNPALFHAHQPPTAADSTHQPDNMAATGTYASSGTGSGYSVDARQLPQLPDVVGHLQGWMEHGVCSAQEFSHHQSGTL